MEINVRSKGYLDLSKHDRVVLSRQRLKSEDFRGRNLLQFSAEGVRMERCQFDDAVIESASFGAGRLTSEYVGCSFNRAKLHMVPVDMLDSSTAPRSSWSGAPSPAGCGR